MFRNRLLGTGNNPIEDDYLSTLTKFFSKLFLQEVTVSGCSQTVLFSRAVGLSVDDVRVIRFCSFCLLNFLK